MSNVNMIANTGHQARLNITSINTRLHGTGIKPLPLPDLDNLPTITAPTTDEVAAAIRAAKGNPATDPKIRELHLRAWLADHPALRVMDAHAWVDAWDHAKTLLPTITKQLRTRYATLGETLTDYANTSLAGVEDLRTLNLSSLDARATRDAANAITTHAEAEALYTAWRTITAITDGGVKPHWIEVTEPTNTQFITAYTSAPQTFPSTDSWSVARKGWTHRLATSFTAAQTARNAYLDHARSTLTQEQSKPKVSFLGPGGAYGSQDRTVTVPTGLLG